MGEKDITEKILEDYNDVFADIVNVLLFSGESIVMEESLEDAGVHSMYKAENTVHELERDVAKLWKDGKVCIALCGLENQTEPDKDEAFRVIGYDGQAYRAQLLKDKDGNKKKDRYPVITLVLYFGMKRWNQPKSLYESFQIPDRLKEYVNDYKINVIEVAYLNDETVQKFQSDFGIIADYFVQMRKNKDYIPSKEEIRHVDELLKFMSVLTKDQRFVEVQNSAEGGVKTMCEVLDRAEEKGMKKGREEGREEGTNRLLDLTGKLVEDGRFEDIKRMTSDKALLEELYREYKI